MEDFGLIELENGIRVVHREVTYTKVAHIGIMLDIGSRDERPEEQGIAHFWEHMAFKGTEKRNSFHIINRLESVGGELNAYTTKEKICFYATVLTEHLDRALELLVDIVFHSTFPVHQIDRERMVILEEMAMYRDTPEDAIQDDLDELIFPDHSLGRNILGTESTVSGFEQKDFQSFLSRNLNTTKIAVSCVGNVKESRLKKAVNRYLVPIPYKNHTHQRTPFSPGKLHQKTLGRPISQVHVALGKNAYAISDERRIPLFMLTNILGGPYMNSRLNLTLREKNGLVYHVEANYSSFLDTGMFSIFFATDPKNLNKSLKLVQKELSQLRDQPMRETQLSKAKQQIKGYLAISEENNNAMMLMMAKSTLDLPEIPTLSMVFKKIDDISAPLLQEIARETFPEEMNQLIYTPEN